MSANTGTTKAAKTLSVVIIIAGAILAVAGAGTYYVVSQTLADEQITVSDDAKHAAGDDVNGPWSAYWQADIIDHHALEAADGKTYAELDQDDPTRETVMDASFLRASLFTSVVSFGVAAMAVGLGIVFILVGWAQLRLAKAIGAPARVEAVATD